MSTAKRETRKRIAEMLKQGMSRDEIFGRLQGGAFRDANLATVLAASPSPELAATHKWKVRIMLLVSALQITLGLFVGWGIGEPAGIETAILAAFLVAAIPSLMFWGFWRNNINAYNAYMLVAMLQIPPQTKMLLDGGWETAAGWIGMGITLSLITYAAVLRHLLFPYMGLFSARSNKEGEYVFS